MTSRPPSQTQIENPEKRLWQKFVGTGLLEKAIKPADFIVPDANLPDLGRTDPAEAMKQLKGLLVAPCYTRLNAKWRKYKQRYLSNLTSLTIKSQTLDRLRAFAVNAGLNGDNYDLVLEYLLDPEEKLESAKQAVAEMPSGLDNQDQGKLLLAKLNLRPSSQRYLLSQLKHSFNQGWLACKQTKKRTVQTRDQASEEYMRIITGISEVKDAGATER
ncbi:hypothetical protein [Bowmanella dokdonensis]|uniref:Uncharacterized protein n=1 Tax=Bowmanella dokdonensis TaxID=751969 RepID=A0A939DKQ1_9ALTE|nr:hypothetical protein [Bowmanella dokdonensis]MBN7824273.1 hypothetical protein [Bowmanella dokdonensis]